MATRKSADSGALDFIQVSQGKFRAIVLGDSPLICHAMSGKAWHELLLPKGKKSAAEKAMSLKHDPLDEFRNSMYYSRDKESPTAIVVKATAFKKAMMGAALDIPGAKKAQIGRLLYVENDEIGIYGIPELMMSITRSADMNKTPDVRTRAVLPAWCAVFTVAFTEPMLKGPVMSKLLAAAGITQGIGDWRVEKGSGNFGRFSLVEEDDPRVRILMESGGREAQQAAINNPMPFDSETEEMMSWFDVEVNRRGFKTVA